MQPGKETPREKKIREAFTVANDLAKKAPAEYKREAFNATFHALLAGTFACPTPDSDDIVEAIQAHSANTTKWLGAIAEAIIGRDQADIAKKLKAAREPLSAAVKKNQP